MMRRPVASGPGTDAAFGIVAPSLPGCSSAEDVLDEAMTNAEEATAWLDAALVVDGPVRPRPASTPCAATPTTQAGRSA